MENVRKHIKLITTERTRNYLVIRFFIEKLLAREIKKTRDTYEKACPFRTFNTRIK